MSLNVCVCRICLAGNIKMHSIANTRLQDIYEKLTNTQWIRDRRPPMICYICRSQLNRCFKFREMAKLSEEIFLRLVTGGFEFTEETVSILNKRKLQKMLVSPVEIFTIGTIMIHDTKVKEEIIPNEEINVLPSLIKQKLEKLLVTPVETWFSGTFLKDSIEVENVQPIPLLNKRKVRKLLMTPVETWFSGTFLKDSIEVENVQPIPILNKRNMQKLLATPVEAWSSGTFLKDSIEVEKVQSMPIPNKIKLRKLLGTPVQAQLSSGTSSKNSFKMEEITPKEVHILNKIKLKKRLVTPVETWTIGSICKNSNGMGKNTTDEVQSTPILSKIKLKKRLVTPVETWTIGTLSKDGTKVNEVQEVQSTPNKIKLQKLLVTPVETWTNGTLSKDGTEVNEVQEVHSTPNIIKLQKLLVTPVEAWSSETLSNKGTEVEEEIQSIGQKIGPGKTMEGTREKDDIIKQNALKKDIKIPRPCDGIIKISSNEDHSSNSRAEKSEMTLITNPIIATNATIDKDATVNTFKEKKELVNTENDIRKSIPCFTLKFKLQDKISNRKTHSDSAKQSATRKRAYPFDITNHEKPKKANRGK